MGSMLTFAVANAQEPITDIAFYDAGAENHKGPSSNVKFNEGMYYDEKGNPFNGAYIAQSNGKVMEEFTIREGRENGKVSFYYPSGDLMEVGYYANGEKDGKWLKWNNEGTKISEASYRKGKKDGTWIIWNDVGTKLYEMNYDAGRKVGAWKMWNEQGKLIEEKDYGF